MTALILFIDNPEHARLEPALAAAVPAESQDRVYEAMLGRLRNLTTMFAGEKYLYYSHYPNWNDAWDINIFRKRIQLGESTGDRIRQAVEDIAEDAPEAIVWMGVSAATQEPAALEMAIRLLNDHDLVIGDDPSGRVILLGFGKKAFNIFKTSIPEPVMSDALTITADAAGITYVRLAVPAAPKTREDLEALQILPD